MNFLSKLKNIFSEKQSSTVPGATIVSGNAVAVWPDRNYDQYAQEAYLNNAYSFRCIDIISKAVASVNWKIAKKLSDGTSEDLTEHVYNNLLNRANIDQSWQSFIYDSTAYLLLSGSSFLMRIGVVAKELWSLNPGNITIVTTPEGRKIAYKYRIANVEKEYAINIISGDSDIHQVRLFNPRGGVWGTAITESAARDIDTSTSAITWNKNLLDNNARPGMIMTTPNMLTDQQYDRLKKSLYEEREGAANAGKSLVLEGALQAVKYSFNPLEMDFIEGSREVGRKIAMSYGVPAQMIGIVGDSTFANFEQAREMFWQDTVVFYLNLFRAELNAWLFRDGQATFEYVLDDVPVFSEKKMKQWKDLETVSFLTHNEKRQLAGFDEIDGGDVLYIPSTLLPLSSSDMPENREESEESLAGEDDELGADEE